MEYHFKNRKHGHKWPIAGGESNARQTHRRMCGLTPSGDRYFTWEFFYGTLKKRVGTPSVYQPIQRRRFGQVKKFKGN
uniref:Uncharacterized protein n=1 Tax=Anguilla anguilla TaxID=7936 RepID=A0A0E9XLK4_ANGAN